MAIQFVRGTPGTAADLVLHSLRRALVIHSRVLWIIPGGSNLSVVVKVMAALSEADTVRLALMLSDERYGPVDHPDSNLKQLYDLGFQPKQATIIPVLRPDLSLEATTELYAQGAAKAFAAAGIIIAQLGMGEDGHIAGILPGSPAAKATKLWTASYEASNFTRITLTPFALEQANEVYVAAFGEAKKTALSNLETTLPLVKQPAQLIKKIPVAVVINDQIGGV